MLTSARFDGDLIQANLSLMNSRSVWVSAFVRTAGIESYSISIQGPMNQHDMATMRAQKLLRVGIGTMNVLLIAFNAERFIAATDADMRPLQRYAINDDTVERFKRTSDRLFDSIGMTIDVANSIICR